jgi:hypothetical protein
MGGFQLCVVHLVWGPLADHLSGFVESYARHSAGHPHDLLVLINNVDVSERARVLSPLERVPHRALVLDTPVQDIEAYRIAARSVPADGYLFLNSYSHLLADGWAARYVEALETPGLGLVGAGGSYRSMRDYNPRRPHPRPALPVYKRVPLYTSMTIRCWETRWRFPPSPNPFVRSNAFAITAAMIDQVGWRQCESKWAAWQFESGRDSLTRRVLAAGRRCVVVGRDGALSDPEEWPSSNTYWSGDQEQLLVADNRSDEYANAPPSQLPTLAARNWAEGPMPQLTLD